MRVGIYLGNFDPTEGGGYSFQYSILQQLAASNHSSFTFTVFYYGKSAVNINGLRSIAIRESYNTRVIRKTKKLANKETKSGLQNAIEKEKIDIVWFTSFSFESVNVPYLYTVWDLQHRLQPYFPEVTLNGQWESREKMYQQALGKASIVLTGTEAGKKELMQFYGIPEKRIRKLLHPTPGLDNVSYADISTLIPANIFGKYLFYPAQFWPHKNHVRILMALKELKENNNMIIPAVFCGSDKGNIDYIKQKGTQWGLKDQLHFLGFVSQEELVALYKNAMALVFPTFFGPENLPPLEAFSLGCPVIASAVEGANEQLGDAALFFDPIDHSGLSKLIIRFKDDSSLAAQLKEKGLKRAAS